MKAQNSVNEKFMNFKNSFKNKMKWINKLWVDYHDYDPELNKIHTKKGTKCPQFNKKLFPKGRSTRNTIRY